MFSDIGIKRKCDRLKMRLTTIGTYPQGTFTFGKTGLYQFEIGWQWDGAYNGQAIKIATCIYKNGFDYVEKLDYKPATSSNTRTDFTCSVLINK